MKVTIALLILGIAGLAQYIYFQFTPLAYNHTFYESGGLTYMTTTRDWTLGLIGAVVGAILLGVGIYRYRHRNVQA